MLSRRHKGLAARLLVDRAGLLPEGPRESDWHGGAVARAFAAGRARGLLPAVRRAIDALTQHLPLHQARPPDIVLGVSLTGPGAAMYLRIDRARQAEGWRTLAAGMEACCGLTSCDGRAATAALRQIGILAGIAVEGSGRHRGRIKAYWRLRTPMPLACIKAPFVSEPEIGDFLHRAIGKRRVNLATLMFSTAFDLATGEPHDGKVDVCGHCVQRPLGEWATILAETAASINLPSGPIGPPDARELGHMMVEYAGFGIDRDGSHRINLYCS